MPSRYSDSVSITGQHFGQISRLLAEMFSRENFLESFVDEKLGRATSAGVQWGSSLSRAIYTLVQRQQCRGQIGLLLECMSQHQPDNQKLTDLIGYLVESGYLHDTQATLAATPVRTYRQSDWLREWDHFTTDAISIKPVVDAMCVTFQTNAELECFLIGSFDHDFARQAAHNISRGDSVRSNIQQVVEHFAKVHWLTALTAAANDAHDQSNIELTLLLMYMRQNNLSPARTVPAAQSATSATAAAPVFAAPPAAPKTLTVTAVCKRLGKTEQSELVDLMLLAFNAHDLREIASFDIGERLDNITPPDALRLMAGRLVEFCVDYEGSVVDLLNGIVKRRLRRADVPAFVQKLADSGYITVG